MITVAQARAALTRARSVRDADLAAARQKDTALWEKDAEWRQKLTEAERKLGDAQYETQRARRALEDAERDSAQLNGKQLSWTTYRGIPLFQDDPCI